MPDLEKEIKAMLTPIGIGGVKHLFNKTSNHSMFTLIDAMDENLSEIELLRLMQECSSPDNPAKSYVGAGSYEHYISADVWDAISSKFKANQTTPQQLQFCEDYLPIIDQYQTQMMDLMGMDVANAFLQDGATALADAILMAIQVNQQSSSKTILMPRSVHPVYRQVVKKLCQAQEVTLIEIPFCQEAGFSALSAFQSHKESDITAVVIPQPNFFGVVEEVDTITNWAHENNALVIGVVNPIALATLKPPGKWGTHGADIVCGEAQSLGIPPVGLYLGFLCTKKAYQDRIPGSLVQHTTDNEGNDRYTLTSQAERSYHSVQANISRQALLVKLATCYLETMSADDLKRVASESHANTGYLVESLSTIPGVQRVFFHQYFHEAVLKVQTDVDKVLARLAEYNILGGYSLKSDYPELGECFLVCSTETKTRDDMDNYHQLLRQILEENTSHNNKLAVAIEVP